MRSLAAYNATLMFTSTLYVCRRWPKCACTVPIFSGSADTFSPPKQSIQRARWKH